MTAPTRRILPTRRPAQVHSVEFNGQAYTIAVGMDLADGRATEVFISHARPDSALQADASDAAVMISLALQHGIGVTTLRESLAYIGDPDRKPVTIYGKALDLVYLEEWKWKQNNGGGR